MALRHFTAFRIVTASSEVLNMASTAPIDTQTVTAKVKTLINTQLKAVLKKEGLPVSGVKAAMQDRIIKRRLSMFHY